ncbi:hypothetical protein [Lachnoclostridium phocaeense]|uniref:hypothetical protein n=1 Tax=Lachnoclostridium phocaeense TaxID=1871021 RepID=UPI00248E79B6|nr:hypothetical protein [Lachnoclostridium phocaeense]
MLKSIKESPKAKIRRNSAVQYDFSNVLTNVADMNKDINKRIQEYEECQAITAYNIHNHNERF